MNTRTKHRERLALKAFWPLPGTVRTLAPSTTLQGRLRGHRAQSISSQFKAFCLAVQE